MPRIEVTFNDVSETQHIPGLADKHSTLSFDVEYRGKRYHCVGHLRQAARSASKQRPRTEFTGYYGYNGPINIQELRNAALDYYESSRRVDTDSAPAAPDQRGEEPVPVNKSYVISVGNQPMRPWKLAS